MKLLSPSNVEGAFKRAKYCVQGRKPWGNKKDSRKQTGTREDTIAIKGKLSQMQHIEPETLSRPVQIENSNKRAAISNKDQHCFQKQLNENKSQETEQQQSAGRAGSTAEQKKKNRCQNHQFLWRSPYMP